MEEIPPEQLAALRREDNGPLTNAVVIAFTVFAFITVALRIFTRACLLRNVGLEDYFIALAMCLSIGMAACQIMQVKWGNGKHVMFLDSEQIMYILKYLYFSILAYCISATFTKVSILLQYRRVFQTKEMRLPIYVVMGLCIGYGVQATFTGIFTCVPVDAFWKLAKQSTARCVKQQKLWYANASLNVATDLLVASLPIKCIWDLQLPKRQKIPLLAILTLGWFVCIVSILRLNALITLANHPKDPTWYSAATAYWSAIEVNLAIVCASTPALRPLLALVNPRFSTTRYGTGRSDYRSDQSKTNSKNRKSFVELKRKSSQGAMSDDVEMGLTALPSADGSRQIHCTKEIEQRVEHVWKNGSDKDYTAASPEIHSPLNGRS